MLYKLFRSFVTRKRTAAELSPQRGKRYDNEGYISLDDNITGYKSLKSLGLVVN